MFRCSAVFFALYQPSDGLWQIGRNYTYYTDKNMYTDIASTFGGLISSNGVENTKYPHFQTVTDESWLKGKSSLIAIGAARNEALYAANETCNAVFSCLDCNTARICQPTTTGKFTPIKTIPCSDGKNPYCDFATGTCGTVPDATCGVKDDFICLGDGYFPDTNCSVYHVCKNLQPHKFQCIIKGEYYNADTQQCDSNAVCNKFDSCEHPGSKVMHAQYQSYYGYCNQFNQPPAVITRCEGINKLNTTSQLCEPICTEDGVLQDVEDCTKYYKCQNLWLNDTLKYMIRERLDCPANTGFDPENFICVSLSQYPECQKKQQLKHNQHRFLRF